MKRFYLCLAAFMAVSYSLAVQANKAAFEQDRVDLKPALTSVSKAHAHQQCLNALPDDSWHCEYYDRDLEIVSMDLQTPFTRMVHGRTGLMLHVYEDIGSYVVTGTHPEGDWPIEQEAFHFQHQ